MSREAVATEKAPRAVGPYSQACRSKGGRTLYLSGQIPLDPKTGELVSGTPPVQAEQCMKNLQAVLEAAGMGFDQVVRCTIYLTNLDWFGAINDVYAKYFSNPPPARAAIQVAGLPKGADVEIDAIAES